MEEQVVECGYCFAELTVEQNEAPVPAVEDDEAWAELAKQHGEGCEWIETRAHRAFVEAK